MTPKFESKTLRKAKTEQEYALYKSAIEWDLVDPIIIEDRSDLKSEHRWGDRVEPYSHQVDNLITFCRRLPVTLLADDVGLGKTISAGLIASELISRGRVSKILIICPKILRDQWKEELETKFNIRSEIVTGQELIRAKAPTDEPYAIITTYNTARLYIERIPKDSYDLLVLDEAHKLRNLFGTDHSPQVAEKFKKSLADRQFKFVLMLTATPIHNRLWDLYSLVDLLSTARGHENPFGSEGNFARKYIADNRSQARHLRPEAENEFRSIIYSYMSRVRRGDANLHFPERVVQLSIVEPTNGEIALINTIAEPIQHLNYFSQIIILQAVISSPEALSKLLEGMARNGTIPRSLSASVNKITATIPITAKLRGLESLIDRLRTEKPETWRIIIFTRWRETQTTIENFLQKKGISSVLINGDTGSRNKENINNFKKSPPKVHVIISTEAGAEGINLQAANVLVNYDLPWNPMIVEQRIGRIQRLSSEFAKVSIFNIVLKGTFEEVIVGRLIEKLQMASTAIGDIESLLEASGIGDDEDGEVSSFEEMIRKLVIASLAGKDVERSTQQTIQSISDAKLKLNEENQNINSLLGNPEDIKVKAPKYPTLPKQVRSMSAMELVLAGLKDIGATLIQNSNGNFVSEFNGRQEVLTFGNSPIQQEDAYTTLYDSNSSNFAKLITKLANKDLHFIEDCDNIPIVEIEKASQDWVETFNGTYNNLNIEKLIRTYSGNALLKVQAKVSCDTYERLVQISCSPDEHIFQSDKIEFSAIQDPISDFAQIGLSSELLTKSALSDSGIKEFCRFYLERRQQECDECGENEQKRKKLEDEFTPRINITLAGLQGEVRIRSRVSISYKLNSEKVYSSELTIIPSTQSLKDVPKLLKCDFSNQFVPEECLNKCEISNKRVIEHFLKSSEISQRKALPEYVITCSLSNRKVLIDEAEISSVTGKLVTRTLLKTSALSGKHAEPEYFSTCQFTNTEVLGIELKISQASNKRYRIDQGLQSSISNKLGHQSEFIFCSETSQPLLFEEAEKCEVTGKLVKPGILEYCIVSGKKVLPNELSKSAVSGRKALKKYFVLSSISSLQILEDESIKSDNGKFCTLMEAIQCVWSNKNSHPDDIAICLLTQLEVRREYLGKDNILNPLKRILDGIVRRSDNMNIWEDLIRIASQEIGSAKFKVEASLKSPNLELLAVSIEVKSWAGLKVRQLGFIYSMKDMNAIGRISIGKRDKTGWSNKE